MKRSLILAACSTLALLVASPAQAQSVTCFTGSIFGGPFLDANGNPEKRCFNNVSLSVSSGGGGNIGPAPTAPSEPGVTEPTPTEPVVTDPTPTDPTDPGVGEPTEPTDPGVEPTDPTEPTDPGVDPTDPTDPTDPGEEPTDPVDPPTDPVDPVDPVEPPTSVPSTPLTPATPNPGVISGNVSDTPFAGTGPGRYENVLYNGIYYDAIVADDGRYVAGPAANPPAPPSEPTPPAPSPMTPATPNAGVYNGTLVGTPYQGTPAGAVNGFVLEQPFTLANGTVIPAGTYSGQIAPNGMFVIRAQ